MDVLKNSTDKTEYEDKYLFSRWDWKFSRHLPKSVISDEPKELVISDWDSNWKKTDFPRIVLELFRIALWN